MNDELRELVASGAKSNVIREAAIRNGMLTLKDYGLYLISQGLASTDEMLTNLSVSSPS
jgi:type II secretory ATPase GspE/PulE/Tfp pilus assembly ATPase PilB-like protein